MSDSPVLMIAHGDLATLAAVALEPDPGRLVLWHPVRSQEHDKGRQEILRQLGQAIGTARVVGMRISDFGFRDCPAPSGPLLEAHLLLSAVIAARQFGASRLVWPAQLARGPEGLAGAIERAQAVVELGAVADPEPGGELALDLPVADLDDRELVEVAEDAGAPMHLFWPCDGDDARPCGACDCCRRWS